jgi:DNA-binding NarL/FixJ family response regulator
MILTAVINDQSLLVQGIISYLRHSDPSTKIKVVEICQPSVFEKLLELHPDVIIIESKDPSNSAICPLNVLFAKLPSLVLVEVNLETSNVQIIRSNNYTASGVTDLLDILKNASESLLTGFH